MPPCSRKFSKFQRGSGIIQALVTVGIVAIIGLATGTLITSMQKGQNSAKFRIDGDNLNEEIRSLLSKPGACTQTFGGLVANAGASFNITSLKDAAGTDKYVQGGRYGDFSVLLNTLTLNDFVAGTDPNKAQMTLISVFQTAKEAVGAQVIERKILISLELDPATRQIISCIALARMTDGIWQRSTTNLNNIFFIGPPAAVPPAPPAPGGFVGIGTDTPGSLLDVTGRDVRDVSLNIKNAGGPTSIFTSLGVMTFSDNNLATPGLNFVRARGTDAAPLPVRAGDRLFSIGAFAWNGANFDSTGNGMIAISSEAEQDFTATSEPRSVTFWTTPSPTGVGNQQRMILRANGDIGMGTVNPLGRVHVHSDTDIGNLIVSGMSDTLTWSLLALGDGSGANLPLASNGWSLAYKRSPDNVAENLTFNYYQRPAGNPLITALQTPLTLRAPSAGFPNGRVGVGSTQPTETLEVLGNSRLDGNLSVTGNGTVTGSLAVTSSITGSVVTAVSDRRLKKDIKPLTPEEIDNAALLQGVSYVRKNQPLGSLREIGFIAQDVERIFPEFVQTDRRGIKSINYSQMTALLLENIKVLQTKIHRCESDSAGLLQKLDKLEARLQLMEQRMKEQ